MARKDLEAACEGIGAASRASATSAGRKRLLAVTYDGQIDLNPRVSLLLMTVR